MKLILLNYDKEIHNTNLSDTGDLAPQEPDHKSPFAFINTQKNGTTSSTGIPKVRLEVDVKYDDMLETSIVRLNDFRAPDNQIIGIYNEYGQKIPLTYNIRSDLTLYYETGVLMP